MTVGETPDDRLFVGTAHGVYSFVRENAYWGSQQTMLPDKHISALIYEPSSQMLFAGSYGRGIYASVDLGRSWDRRDQGIGDRGIYSLAFQKVAGRPRLYAGTDPAHLFYSDNLGLSWTEFTGLRQVPGVENWTYPGAPHLAHVKDITFDPRQPDTIYAAVEVGGIFKSIDGGKTWSIVIGLNPDAHRVLIPASDPDKVSQVMPTTNCDETVTAWVCVSQYGGKSWEVLVGGLPEHIRGNGEGMAMDVWKGAYALFAGTTNGEAFYSSDEGEHWREVIRDIGPVSKSHHYQNLQVSAA